MLFPGIEFPGLYSAKMPTEPNVLPLKEYGTEGGTRTPKVLLPVDFESTASTSSATSAKVKSADRTAGGINYKIYPTIAISFS